MDELSSAIRQDNAFDCIQKDILCMDIIKKLKPAKEQYEVEVRRFIHISMERGFDRNMVRHSIAVFESEINGLIDMVESYLEASNSPKTRILKSEILAMKSSISVFVKTVEKIILEKPEIENQIFIGKRG